MCQTSTLPLTVSAKRTKASTIWMVWVTMSVRRLGTASAMRPPKRPKTRTGRNCAAVVSPSTNGSWVSSRISHACATDCIQVPVNETVWPLKKRR